ncbi:MAG: universal stress protein [Rhodobacteraceae bacterium]|nr:MAG: universal stress protein [Paracoccaceae bacterium]
MSYKSLFTAVTDPELQQKTLAQAADLAAQYDAHLDVLCLGVDASQTGYYFAGANAVVMQEAMARASEDAKALEASTTAFLSKTEIRWSCDAAMAQIGDLGRLVATHARFSDLVVLPKPYGARRGSEQEAVIEGAMFAGQTPVLVMPQAAQAQGAPKRVVVAWNEGSEALRAVRSSLPILKSAERVSIVVVDPPVHGPNRSDPGGPLSQYLSRHGVKVEIEVLAKSLPRVSDVLLRYATDSSADMLVMGAYGHSRFREAILGGATRDMLEQATLPVFMAH